MIEWSGRQDSNPRCRGGSPEPYQTWLRPRGEVGDGLHQEAGRIAQVADSLIAGAAEQAADATCLVVMVDAESRLRWAPADGAAFFLLDKKHQVVCLVHPMLTKDAAHPRPPSLARAALTELAARLRRVSAAARRTPSTWIPYSGAAHVRMHNMHTGAWSTSESNFYFSRGLCGWSSRYWEGPAARRGRGKQGGPLCAAT